MKALSQRQREVLAFLESARSSGTLPPSIREVAREFGISSAGAAGHLAALERKGFVRRDPRVARGITILRKSPAHAPTRVPSGSQVTSRVSSAG